MPTPGGPIKPTGSQIVDLLTVNRAIEAKIERIQGAAIAKVRGFGAPINHTLLAHIEFILQEQFEKLQMIEVIAACFLKAYLQAAGQSAQAQLA